MEFKEARTVALLSSEAEYTAATSATRQALWLRKLLANFNYEQNKVTKILCDNRSAIAMARNPVFHGRTKHINLQHHFILKLVIDGK